MSFQRVTIIDHDQHAIATAQVSEQDGSFIGQIDIDGMPPMLRQQFEEYEDIVNSQLFSLLDDIEERIAALSLSGMFDDGREARLEDVQIYPSAGNVSFKVAKKVVGHSSNG